MGIGSSMGKELEALKSEVSKDSEIDTERVEWFGAGGCRHRGGWEGNRAILEWP